MGFAISWVTPLVVGAVMDRNPIASKDLRKKFNKLLSDARTAMQHGDEKHRSLGENEQVSNQPAVSFDRETLNALPEEFFVDFAGQGRLR